MRLRLLLAATALLIAVALVITPAPPEDPTSLTDAELVAMHPVARPPADHARAAECRECHQHNHDTWHASYHRTMTQLVTPETAAADFNNVRIDMPGVRETFLLHRRDGRPWVAFDKNITTFPISKLERKNFPLLMTTGSHHMQYYWAPTGRKRSLAQLPVVYLFEDQRWIPVSASFLNAPNVSAHGAGSTWSESCVKCHSTFPEIRHSGEFLEYDTTVAEFGIACESCHGPGAEHIRLHQAQSLPGPKTDDPIVNPATLSPELSAQVCGGCHSVFDQEPWQPHRPGESFAENRRLKTRENQLANVEDRLSHPSPEEIEKVKLDLDNWFWPDGMSRVTGREYNNLLESACHTKGGMTCLDCHRMHQAKTDSRPAREWANDQLHHDRADDQVCHNCHAPASYATPAHTRHRPESSGSRCYNCHLPHTSYGLFQAIRTHTITSPDARVSQSTGRPTACNLCHLDQPLGWTAQNLEAWYGRPAPKLDTADHEVSQVVRLLLEGDAAQRALMAWALSWEPAVATSGDEWPAPYLALLLKDPYPAVRHMAARSLRSLPGFADFKYDFLGDSATLASAAETARARWQAEQPQRADHGRPAVLLNAAGDLEAASVERHYARRNDRVIVIAE